MDLGKLLLIGAAVGVGVYLYKTRTPADPTVHFALAPDVPATADQLALASRFCFNAGGSPNAAARSCAIPWSMLKASQPAGMTFDQWSARVPSDPQIQSGVASWDPAALTVTLRPGYNWFSGLAV